MNTQDTRPKSKKKTKTKTHKNTTQHRKIKTMNNTDPTKRPLVNPGTR